MNLCVQFHQSNPHNTQQRGMNSEKNYCCVELQYCCAASCLPRLAEVSRTELMMSC